MSEEQQEKNGQTTYKVDKAAGDDFWMIAEPEKVTEEDKPFLDFIERIRFALIDEDPLSELIDQENIISDELWSSINQNGRALLLVSFLFVQKETHGKF